MMWLCPEEDIDEANERVGYELTLWIDPHWGLERSSRT
jgi:hypothetical protein